MTRDPAQQIKEAVYDAHMSPPFAEMLALVTERCGCGHQTDQHHGPDGMGVCAETGCGCLGWHPAQVECPDCGTLWPDTRTCPSCGLTIEDVAERLAARAHADRRKEWTTR